MGLVSGKSAISIPILIILCFKNKQIRSVGDPRYAGRCDNISLSWFAKNLKTNYCRNAYLEEKKVTATALQTSFNFEFWRILMYNCFTISDSKDSWTLFISPLRSPQNSLRYFSFINSKFEAIFVIHISIKLQEDAFEASALTAQKLVTKAFLIALNSQFGLLNYLIILIS